MSAAEYADSVRALEEAHEAGLRAFAKWHAANWKQTLEEWQSSTADVPPGGKEYFDGYNAGVESVMDSVDSFLQDFGR